MAAAAAPLLNDLQDGIAQSLKEVGAGDGVATLAGRLISGATAAGIGAALGDTAGAVTAFNADANNRQLHPTEARLIKDNAKRYAERRGGISTEQAEAELTQKALRNIDSAHAACLGDDDPQAQAFLAELGAGQQQTDGLTGQSYQLFAADQATRENHAMFGQYAKTSPAAQALLDNAYRAVFRPAGGQVLAGVTGSAAGALTGSDLALNDAARDTGNMRNQPPMVQWAVLGQLRQERADNLGRQKALLIELQAMNERADTGAQAAQRRGEIVEALTLLDRENSVLRQASQLHILTMGSAGLLRPIDQRELIEGFGEGRSLAGVSLRGLSAASIGARLRELNEVIAQSRAATAAATAAARAEAEAIAKARVENHVNADNDIFTGTGQNTKGDTSPDFKGNTTLDEHLSTGGPHRKTVYGAHSDEASVF